MAAVLAFALSAIASAAGALAGPVYRIDPALTSVEFEVSQFGLWTQRGRFARTRGNVAYDPVAQTGSVELVVDVASVETGWDLRDQFVRGESMLDAGHHPALRFRSTRLDFIEHRLIGVDGILTLRGVTRPVRLDVRYVHCGTQAADGREGCGARIIGRISRLAFGIGFAYPMVGDEIELDFAVTAFRDPPSPAQR
jgi:polyisoprenoid-binding protein YceI